MSDWSIQSANLSASSSHFEPSGTCSPESRRGERIYPAKSLIYVERQAVKKALEEIAREEPEFLIDLIADAASSRRDLALKLASVVAGVVAVPLDVATKQDLRRLERRTARLEREVKEIKNAMATKEDLRQYATKQVLGTAV